MDSFHHVRIPRERLEGGRIISLPQVRSRALLRLEINQRLPGQVILQVAPEPLHGVQLWTIRWRHTARTLAGHRRRWAVWAPL